MKLNNSKPKGEILNIEFVKMNLKKDRETVQWVPWNNQIFIQVSCDTGRHCTHTQETKASYADRVHVNNS